MKSEFHYQKLFSFFTVKLNRKAKKQLLITCPNTLSSQEKTDDHLMLYIFYYNFFHAYISVREKTLEKLNCIHTQKRATET